MFQADSGKPLKRVAKKPPLRPGSGNYTRAYSFSIVGFAARCFHLGELPDEANAALVENARHYLDNPKDIIDRDSFHWHADIVMRLIDMYGPNGTVHPARLTAETEAACLQPIWLYVKESSKHNKPNHATTKTWHFHSTENHHAMDFSLQWHFAKIARDKPDYKNPKLDDGSSLEQHYRAWNEYIVVYFRERAKKGVSIEMMCPGYNSVWLKGFYNFRDFGEPEVRRSAGMFLDLYWAYCAQEQLRGVEGGGKARIRGVNGFKNATHGIPALGWFYFGIGEKPKVILGEINALLSDYEPPTLVAEIARSAAPTSRMRSSSESRGSASKGSMITQKLKGNKTGGPMIVWMPLEGMGELMRDGNLVFVETEGAYAAIRVVGSDFKFTEQKVSNPSMEGPTRVAPPGRVILPEDDFAPVILEVMAKKDVGDFDAFKAKVKANQPEMKGALLVCKTVYGDHLTFDTSQKQTPTINGKPVDCAPQKVLQSPFLNADYDHGVVTLQKGASKKILDFTE